MTVSAGIQAELPFLRAEAEARMLDRCEIRYKTGSGTQDPVTGEKSPQYAVRFATKCRVKVSDGLSVREADVGGRTAVSVTRQLHIPVGSPAVQPGDIAVVTSVHASSDRTLLGATLVLAGPAPGSQTTARRLQVSEVIA